MSSNADINVKQSEGATAISHTRCGKHGARLRLSALCGAATLVAALGAQASEYKVKAGASSVHWNVYTTWKIRDPNTGNWVDTTNALQYPKWTDTAYIPNNLYVWVAGDSGNGYIAHEEVHDVYICGDDETSGSFAECTNADGQGIIYINGGSSLTVYADSICNGDIAFAPFNTASSTNCGELRLHQDSGPSDPGILKITGKGGRIVTPGVCGRIEADDDTPDTILRITGHTPGAIDTSMTIEAENLDMFVPVTLNNRGDVLAYSADVYLTDTRKDGNSGKWRAAGGTMHVNYEVRGGGTWITEYHVSKTPLIQFNADCENLSGNFSIKYGRVRANALVCTTGHGEHGGQSSDGPRVSATPGHKITFHGDCQ